MKSTILIIASLLTLVSCNVQEKQIDLKQQSDSLYEVMSEATIRFGEHTTILNFKPTADKNYLLFIRTEPKNDGPKNEFYFLKISPKGDSIGSWAVAFEHLLTDYIELEHCYYVVTTDRRTMGGYTTDFLHKYDKNWKLIWTKKIDKPKYPDGSTVLTLTNNKELLLIANEFLPRSQKKGISFKRYNLDGNLISERMILTKCVSNPISMIPSNDNTYYLTTEQYDEKANFNSLWLLKLNQKGDTLWTKKIPHFHAHQTMLTKQGELLFYGSNYSSSEEREEHPRYLKIIKLDQSGNLLWQKEIKQYYYEDPGNVIRNKIGNYLFSSTIIPIKDKGSRTFLFELDEKGNLIFSRKFDNSAGINSIPYLIRTEGQITLIGQQWIGQFDDPFHDVIHITTLME